MTNALQRLHAEQDQSPWIDFIDRELITSGKLAEMVGDGIRGLTSNPTIFAKAVATGQYDELIRREIDAGDGAREIYEEIAVGDVGDAADVLRSVHDASEGADGFASIEVEPDLARDLVDLLLPVVVRRRRVALHAEHGGREDLFVVLRRARHEERQDDQGKKKTR